MRAIRYHGPRQPFRLEDLPRPEPGPGEVRVKVTAAAMCHTELHLLSGLVDLGVEPLTLGHEVVGRVDAVGDGVAEDRLGERVILYDYEGCGGCRHCQVGDEQLCPDLRAELGFVTDGGWAEYALAPAGNAVPLPDEVGDVEAAPIGCGVTTAVHAAGLAGLGLGEWVVVYGAGGVGFGLIQLARARGARVIAVGRSAAKLALATELGAEVALNAELEPVAEGVRDVTEGAGADVVFECVGTAETTRQAADALGRRGRLVVIGYSADPFTLNPLRLVALEQRVQGSVGATRRDLRAAIDLVARGVVRTVVDRTLPLADWERGLRALAQGELVGKAVLVP